MIGELVPVNRGIDEIADVERRAHRVHRVPHAYEGDARLLVPRVFVLESLEHFRVRPDVQQLREPGLIMLAIGFVGVRYGFIESVIGRQGFGIENAAR